MPKEITHWIVAREAASSLDAGTRTGAAVAACPAAFLLGAVAHDGPYYARGDKTKAAAGDRLHGKGVDDAFESVKRILRAEALPPAALAFSAGVLSHIAADTVFHPAVFYFTGFPGHPDTSVAGSYMYRHWGFESAMDLHFLSARGEGIELKLKALYERASTQGDPEGLLRAVARFYATAGEEPSSEAADLILRQAGRTQGIFFNIALRALAGLLNAGRPGTNADTSAAFYRLRSPWNAFMEGDRPYRNPISGMEALFSADAFFSEAVHRTQALIGFLERAVAGEEGAFPFPGPCLDSGHPLDQDQKMRFCDPGILSAS
jgi:hypothetical protein